MKKFLLKIGLSIFVITLTLATCELLCGAFIAWGFIKPGYRKPAAPDTRVYESQLPSLVETGRPKDKKYKTPLYNSADYDEARHFVDYNGELFFAKKNYSGRAILKRKADGKVIYDASVSTDDHGRRRIHAPTESATARPQHALFLGCSYIWGEWLSDEDTLPWMLQHRQTRFEALQFGFYVLQPGPPLPNDRQV